MTTNPLLLAAFITITTSIATWALANGLRWLTTRYRARQQETA